MNSAKAIVFIANPKSTHSLKWISTIADLGDHKCIWLSLAQRPKALSQSSSSIKFIQISRQPIALIRFIRLYLCTKNLVIHHHYIGLNTILVFFLLVLRRVPLVSTPWGSDLNLTNYLKSIILHIYFKIPALCTSDADYFIEKIFAFNPSLSTHRVNFGVDTARFKPKDLSFVTRNTEKSPILDIISLRSLEKIYDIDTLLYAYQYFIRQGGRGNLTIVGDGSEKTRLIGLSRELRITPNFAGRISQADIIKLLQSSSIYVSTSLSDAGLASSTAEAMACGVPVIVSDNSENSQWIKHGANGLLFTNHDYKALAQCIHLLSSNDQLRNSMGLAGRSIIEEKNSIQSQMVFMNDLYKSL